VPPHLQPLDDQVVVRHASPPLTDTEAQYNCDQVSLQLDAAARAASKKTAKPLKVSGFAESLQPVTGNWKLRLPR
jgi:hypothetical protein